MKSSFLFGGFVAASFITTASAAGFDTVTVKNANSNGAATSANSSPVVLPTDEKWGTPSAAVGGSYCMTEVSGSMAAGLAAGAVIAEFRNSSSTNLDIIRHISLSAGDTSTAFTAGVVTFQLFAARSYSANGSGGNSATLTGNNGKLRTSFPTTTIADFRVSSTAALTAGTWTLDTTPLIAISNGLTATAGVQITPPGTQDLLWPQIGEQPLQLAQNEGFAIEATVPATGIWTFSVKVCWDEATAY